MTDWIPLLFALLACSWVPHFTCHYYRLETGSSFVVGQWQFSRGHSVIMTGIYSLLVLLGLTAIMRPEVRLPLVIGSAFLHGALAFLHLYRLNRWFRFEVLGYPWSRQSSIRESLIELSLCACFVRLALNLPLR